MEEDRLLKSDEVAEKLCVSRSFAYQLMKRGEIKTVRIGRTVRVRQQDLNEYIEKRTSGKPTSGSSLW